MPLSQADLWTRCPQSKQETDRIIRISIEHSDYLPPYFLPNVKRKSFCPTLIVQVALVIFLVFLETVRGLALVPPDGFARVDVTRFRRRVSGCRVGVSARLRCCLTSPSRKQLRVLHLTCPGVTSSSPRDSPSFRYYGSLVFP